jgi:hypothetical protein
MNSSKTRDAKSRIVLSLPSKVKHELKVLAAFDNQSIGQIVLAFINDGIDKNRTKIAKVFGK